MVHSYLEKSVHVFTSIVQIGLTNISRNKMGRDYFNTLYRASFIILYYDQQMHDYLTNFHTPTCFDTTVSSSWSL